MLSTYDVKSRNLIKLGVFRIHDWDSSNDLAPSPRQLLLLQSYLPIKICFGGNLIRLIEVLVKPIFIGKFDCIYICRSVSVFLIESYRLTRSSILSLNQSSKVRVLVCQVFMLIYSQILFYKHHTKCRILCLYRFWRLRRVRSLAILRPLPPTLFDTLLSDTITSLFDSASNNSSFHLLAHLIKLIIAHK
jgi:hypothetical protein